MQSQNFKMQNSLGEQAQGGAVSQNFSVKGGFLQRIKETGPVNKTTLENLKTRLVITEDDKIEVKKLAKNWQLMN